MKNYNLTLSDISPKLAKEVKEIIRTDKGIDNLRYISLLLVKSLFIIYLLK